MEDSFEKKLVASAGRGDLSALQMLIERGADIDWQDAQGDTSLIMAAREGHFEVCRKLLSNGANVAKTNRWGSTAIHAASGYGHRDIVLLLIVNGSDVNWMDISGNTPSHCAAFWERIGVLEDLYTHGADWYIQNTEGRDVLKSAKLDRKHVAAQFIDAVRTGRRTLERIPTDESKGAVVQRDQMIRKLQGEIERLKQRTDGTQDEANEMAKSPATPSDKWIVQLRTQYELSSQEQLQERVEYLQTRIKNESMQNSMLKRSIDLLKRDVTTIDRQKISVEKQLKTQTKELDDLRQKASKQKAQLRLQQRAIDTLPIRQKEDAPRSQVEYYRLAKENAETAFHQVTERMTTFQQVGTIPYEDIKLRDIDLGRGLFSETQLGCWHGSAVAVKTFNIDQDKRHLLRQEISACSRLYHPHLAAIYGFVRIEGVLMMAMELFQGSLVDLIEAQSHVCGATRHLTLREEVDVSHDALSGLTYLHQLKPHYIVHGHIRPTNVLLLSDMTAKLSDIVEPCCCDSSCDKLLHASQYIAPERLDDCSVPQSPSTDMYSIGTTLGQLSFGRRPTSSGHVYLRKRRAVFSLCVRDLCLRMASGNPLNRISSAEAVKLLNDLKATKSYRKCHPRRMVKRSLESEAAVIRLDRRS